MAGTVSWQAQAWLAVAMLAAGGVLAWTALIMVLFPGWPCPRLLAAGRREPVPAGDLLAEADTLPPTRLMAAHDG